MENQSASMEFLLLEDVQFLEVNDDALSQWELVNVLDTEEVGGDENCDDGDSSVQVGFNPWNSLELLNVIPTDGPIVCEGIHYRLLHPDMEMKEDRDVGDDGIGDRRFNDVDDVNRGYQFDDDDNDDDDGDDDDDDDGYGLDDELVPWSVSSKFERQRMRKLGKRSFSKMHSSKRSPYLFVRPGCVHGKHGLGLKHNY